MTEFLNALNQTCRRMWLTEMTHRRRKREVRGAQNELKEDPDRNTLSSLKATVSTGHLRTLQVELTQSKTKLATRTLKMRKKREETRRQRVFSSPCPCTWRTCANNRSCRLSRPLHLLPPHTVPSAYLTLRSLPFLERGEHD